MANVDTSIYGQIRPFKMEDPYEGAAKVMQLRAAQRQFTMDEDIGVAAREADGDPEKMATALLQRGHYQPALQLRAQAAAAAKEKRLADNADVDRQLKLAEAAGSDAMTLDTIWRQALQQSGGDRNAAMTRIHPAYAQVRANWAKLGKALPEAFDPDANFAGIGQAKEAVQYLKGLQPQSDLGKLLAERDGLPANDPRRKSYDDAITKKTSEPTELARLAAERDRLPEGSPMRATYDRVLANYKAGKGDTNVVVNSGPMLPGKTAGNEIDKDILGSTQNLMRLDAIQSQFKPEYQTLMTRGSQWWNAGREKLGANLTNKEKADLESFSQYKRNAIDSLNRYIKEITGAAMTDQEAQRILRGLPNPGAGLWDGDSPTEFKAKLDDAIKQTKVSVARLAYIKRNGMSLEDGKGNATVPLDRMPQIINDRGKAIEEELKKTGVTGKPLERAVRRQLGVEFGLVSD